MDVFSILLPGALLTWLLMGEVGPAVLGDRYATLAGAEAWAVFLFASYLLGHLVFLLGCWLDEFYDWTRRCTLSVRSVQLLRAMSAFAGRAVLGKRPKPQAWSRQEQPHEQR